LSERVVFSTIAGTDPFTYCGNNPVNCYDPSGNITLGEVMTTVWIGAKITFGLFSGCYDMIRGNEQMKKGDVGGALLSYASRRVFESMTSEAV